MRAVLDNRQRKLWPGQYVRVQLGDLSLHQAITIPRRAVLSSAQGYSVWVLTAENMAQSRNVKLGPAVGESVLINEGLRDGDRYVLDGLFKVQTGMIVKPMASEKLSADQSSKTSSSVVASGPA